MAISRVASQLWKVTFEMPARHLQARKIVLVSKFSSLFRILINLEVTKIVPKVPNLTRGRGQLNIKKLFMVNQYCKLILSVRTGSRLGLGWYSRVSQSRASGTSRERSDEEGVRRGVCRRFIDAAVPWYQLLVSRSDWLNRLLLTVLR